MRIKIRSWLFLLFGFQGVFQVIYWELIKRYPACLMCKGYRVLYISILVTALIYRYRASMFRLLLLCGLIIMETVWSLWDVVQKIGFASQKCHAVSRSVEGKMVFTSCMPHTASLFKVFCSPVGLNALLSLLMCGYSVWVVGRIKFWRLKSFRWGVCVIFLNHTYGTEAKSSLEIDKPLRQALHTQEQRAKQYESEINALTKSADIPSKAYQKEAAAMIKQAPTKEALESVRAAISPQDACKGKCPSFKPTSEFEPSLQVCMSFSVPVQVWKDLNADLLKRNGVFVINGLPNNSFQAFAQKVLAFRQQGITAPIRIDPKLFEQLKVQHVPIFVVKDSSKMHTVSGTVTIPYVMDLMHINTGEGQ
jgi:type-F conjugative transfer system pilin assembly protein TrbC